MQKLKNDLKDRKYEVVNFLYSLFAGLSLFAVLYQIVSIVILQKHISPIVVLVSVLISTMFIWAKFYLVRKNIVLSAYVLIFLLLFYAGFSAFKGGVPQPAIYLLLSVVITTASIVVSVKASIKIFIASAVYLLFITYLHVNEIVPYTPEFTNSTYPSSGMFLLLAFILTIVSYIGFKEIEHSYAKAYEYAKELERLNDDLEKEVEVKTTKIREAYRKQSEIMYKQAILGNITQSLLHDIANPMSVVRGSTKLLKSSYPEEVNISTIEDSLRQMDQLVENSKHLILRDESISEFSPLEEVEKSLSVFSKRMSSANIKVEVKISKKLRLNGSSVLFNRIVSNILMNAIEELEDLDQESKKVNISGKQDEGVFQLRVMDNGRGMSPELMNRIFEIEFSSKSISHLGFGLSFVKEMLEERFQGFIEVESKEGEGSSFIISIPQNV